MRARFILGEGHAAAIRTAAAQAFPLECCGLLIGDGSEPVVVRRIVTTPNTAADPARHFEIDPQILLDHMRSGRETNMRIVGHYHSHPNGRAEPSAADLAMAHDSSVWVIAAVAKNGVALRAFVPVDGGFGEILLEA